MDLINARNMEHINIIDFHINNLLNYPQNSMET